MKNTSEALKDISIKLTREIRSIIRSRDHVETGMLLSNITVEAIYNPLAHKTSFTIIYNAPYYWVYVDALSPKKKTATWTTTCTQALKKSGVYTECREQLVEALKKDLVPLDKSRTDINNIIGGALRVAAIRSLIISIINDED